MTATLHLPPSVYVYVLVCVCEWECETGIEICAQGQSTDLPVFFFISLCFVISVFILEREQRSKAALQVFAALYAKFTQIAADNANEEKRERDWREREVKSLERKQRRRKLKAIFNFLSWRKLKNLLQPPAQHTHKHTHIYICTHRDKLKFVFRYLKIPRSCAQASRN